MPTQTSSSKSAAGIPQTREIETGLENFIAANAESPVVEGSAIGKGGEGAYYTLKNGRKFRLTKEECAKIETPRWDFG